MKLVLRKARKAPATGQPDLFSGPRTGVGEQHHVGQHLAHNPGGAGLHVVKDHERTGRGRKLALTPPPAAADTADDGSTRKLHHDVGAKIGAARKDLARKVTRATLPEIEAGGEAEAVRRVTKSAVLDAHDPELDRSLGMSPGASALRGKILASVSAVPIMRDGEPAPMRLVRRALYVDACAWLTGSLNRLTSVEHVREWVREVMHHDRGLFREEPRTASEVYAAIGHKIGTPTHGGGWTRIGTEQVPYATLSAAGYIDVDTVRVDGETRYRLVKKDSDATSLTALYVQSLGPKFENIIRGKSEAWNDAVRAADRLQDWPAAKGDAPPKKERGETWTRAVTDIRREGGPRAVGPFTAEKLRQKFNLRGVEFGNWVDDRHAGRHIEYAHKALLDLADVLGLDPRQVTHGGRLGLAFGARGHGKHAAHYEPNRTVINLTNTVGAGSLAHEWGHFLDHQLSGGSDAPVFEGGRARAPYLSHGEAAEFIHPDVEEALDRVMRTIEHGPMSDEDHAFAEDVRALNVRRQALDVLRTKARRDPSLVATTNDATRAFNRASIDHRQKWSGRTLPTSRFTSDAQALGDYWHRKHERFARAFESYVEDKLHAAGRANTYLVSGTSGEYGLRRANSTGAHEPYPQGAEREAIHREFDRFFDAVRASGDLQKALDRQLKIPHRPGAPRGLHVEAALVDRHLKKGVAELAAVRAELEAAIAKSRSPLERARLQKALYEVDETAGAVRYSPVTGSDSSDLPRSP